MLNWVKAHSMCLLQESFALMTLTACPGPMSFLSRTSCLRSAIKQGGQEQTHFQDRFFIVFFRLQSACKGGKLYNRYYSKKNHSQGFRPERLCLCRTDSQADDAGWNIWKHACAGSGLAYSMLYHKGLSAFWLPWYADRRRQIFFVSGGGEEIPRYDGNSQNECVSLASDWWSWLENWKQEISTAASE